MIFLLHAQKKQEKVCINCRGMACVMDEGFPIGTVGNPLGQAPTCHFAKFSKKLHEIENISGTFPLDLPMGYVSLVTTRYVLDRIVIEHLVSLV